VTDTFREQVRENAFRFDQFTSTSALFLPGGQLPAAGAVFRNLDLAATYAMTTVQALHHYLEATRLAFADRNRYIGDPSQVPVPAQQLLSASFGRQRACLINPAKAATSPVPPGDPFAGAGGCVPAQPAPTGQPSDGASTNNLVVADRWGDVVSYTTTIEELGGNADPAEPPRRRRAGSPWRGGGRRRGTRRPGGTLRRVPRYAYLRSCRRCRLSLPGCHGLGHSVQLRRSPLLAPDEQYSRSPCLLFDVR
jgi:hypothetical protein